MTDRSNRIIIRELGSLATPADGLNLPALPKRSRGLVVWAAIGTGWLALAALAAAIEARLGLLLVVVPVVMTIQTSKRRGPMVTSRRHASQTHAIDVLREWAKLREFRMQTSDTGLEAYVELDHASYLTLHADVAEVRILFRMSWLPLRIAVDRAELAGDRVVATDPTLAAKATEYAGLSHDARGDDDPSLWLPSPVRELWADLSERGAIIRGGGEVLVEKIAYERRLLTTLMGTLDRLAALHSIWREIADQAPLWRAVSVLSQEDRPEGVRAQLDGWHDRKCAWLSRAAEEHCKRGKGQARADALRFVSQETRSTLLEALVSDTKADLRTIRSALQYFHESEPTLCGAAIRRRAESESTALLPPTKEFVIASKRNNRDATCELDPATPTAIHACATYLWGVALGCRPQTLARWVKAVEAAAIPSDFELLKSIAGGSHSPELRQEIEEAAEKLERAIEEEQHRRAGALTMAEADAPAGLSVVSDDTTTNSILRRRR